MNTIDIEALLTPISPEAPSGDGDLVELGDPDYVALEIMMKGTPERQYNGKTIQEAKDPNWGQVREAAAGLLARTHDLRVVLFLTRAMLHTEGLQGLEIGLALLHGLIDRYWDTLHPQLDPTDNYDPTIRNTTLELLSTGEDILGPLKKIDLCVSPSLGRFNYRDILIAAGKLTPVEANSTATPAMVDIEAAFKDTDPAVLSTKMAAVDKALSHLLAIKTTLAEKVGNSGSGPDLSAFQQVLREMDEILAKHLEGRQTQPDFEAEVAEEDETTGGGRKGGAVDGPEGKIMNGINGRQDVVRLLDNICAYYQRNEPGSPVPLLLKRARQLVDKNFLEIIQDLAPDSAGKIKSLISGVEKEA